MWWKVIPVLVGQLQKEDAGALIDSSGIKFPFFLYENLSSLGFLLTWTKIKFQNIQILHETALRLSLEPQLLLLAVINPTSIIKRIFLLRKRLKSLSRPNP